MRVFLRSKYLCIALLSSWAFSPICAQRLSQEGTEKAQAATPSPLMVEMGSIRLPADDAALEIGIFPLGSRAESLVSIQNVSERTIEVDAFSVGSDLLALWEPPRQVPATRMSLSPGDRRNLHIQLLSSAKGTHNPSIIFMEAWKEIGHIDFLYLPIAVPPPSEQEFGMRVSGMGKEAAHYRFCSRPAPPGFSIQKATPHLIQSPGDRDDPRGCLSWASCPVDQPRSPGEGACFAPWVQGHSEGDSHVKDKTVMFEFSMTVEYRANPTQFVLRSRSDILKEIADASKSH
jgi:hypothetical protein